MTSPFSLNGGQYAWNIDALGLGVTMAITFQAIWVEVNSCDHSYHYSGTFPIHFNGNFAKVSNE